MKTIKLFLVACTLFLISASANAWFIFIPGAVTQAIGDAITGAKGNNCVGTGTKVGDIVSNPNGQLFQVKSLSGTSTLCNGATPIRAELEASPDPSTNAKIDMPEEWFFQDITVPMKVAGTVLHAINKTDHSTLSINTFKRGPIREKMDMVAYVNTIKGFRLNELQDAQQSEVMTLVINGIPAWRFEVSGRKLSGVVTQVTYLVTIFEGEQEIVVVTVSNANWNEVIKNRLVKLVDSLTGMNPAPEFAKELEEKKLASEREARDKAAAEEMKRLAADEEKRRLAADLDAKRSKSNKSSNPLLRLPQNNVLAVNTDQIDFNAEAKKSARILGCSPSELKVTGIEAGNILYFVMCEGASSLMLSCDRSGLCLKKKGLLGE